MSGLTEDERLLVSRLFRTIQDRSRRNLLRGDFSEAEVKLRSLGVEIPPGMERFMTALSWPQKAVTAFADRQIPTGFSTHEPTSLVDDVEAAWEDNSFDSREREAIEAADELGCSFVFSTYGDVSAGEPYVVLSPRTALTATAELDPRTGEVSAALEVVGQDEANLYLPHRVVHLERGTGGEWSRVDEVSTPTSRVQCAVYVHGSKLGKPFGRSRISRPVMDLTLAGMRTLIRQEVAAQFFMHPRFLLLGADVSSFTDPSTGRELSPWDVMMGAVNGLPDVTTDDDPDVPDSLRRAGVHTFQQLSMQPFSDQFRLLAAAFSGESSIPPQYLGVVQDSNPTSAQAIEASEVDLVRKVRAQNPILGRGRRTLALNVLSLIHGSRLDPEAYAELRGLTARWEDPRTRSMAEQSNMVHQQTQIGNLQAGTRTTLGLLPFSKETVEAAARENERAAGGSLLDQIMAESAGDGVPLSDRANTFGILIRSGVSPESAARIAGLEGVEMVPGIIPASLRDEGA
ncbi:hypothetical protein [Nesterenkonia suensis]